MWQENKQQLNLTPGFCRISKIWGWFGASTLGILLPASVGIAAQVVEPEVFNSERLLNSRTLVAQSYSCDGCETAQDKFYYFEAQGDRARDNGYWYYDKQNYNMAYNSFHKAVNMYDLCLQVELRDSVSQSEMQEVINKRDRAAQNRERLQQIRASR